MVQGGLKVLAEEGGTRKATGALGGKAGWFTSGVAAKLALNFTLSHPNWQDAFSGFRAPSTKLHRS